MRRMNLKGLFAAVTAVSLAAAPASALTRQEVRMIQGNVEKAFLLHYLHRNKDKVHAASGTIRSIGVRIVRATGQAFSNTAHFYEMETPDVNASTSPGGNVFLYRGLLNGNLSQDETAAVLAHEIAHIMHLHWLQRMVRGINAQKVAQYAAKAYGRDSAEIAYLNEQLQNLRYDRSEELQADETGARLMVTAGFKPQGMVTLLSKVQALESPAQKAMGRKPFLSNHPAIPDRIARMQMLINSGRLQPIKKRLY
ncbi:MAG: M48 family metalloprotease [Elusimicrobia bacterium]|nr:M48 family metalloprotease [Elusimicrobiota bacterium]